jgi:hypothetical protein
VSLSAGPVPTGAAAAAAATIAAWRNHVRCCCVSRVVGGRIVVMTASALDVTSLHTHRRVHIDAAALHRTPDAGGGETAVSKERGETTDGWLSSVESEAEHATP